MADDKRYMDVLERVLNGLIQRGCWSVYCRAVKGLRTDWSAS